MSQTLFDVHVADNPFSLEPSLWSECLSSFNPIAVQASSYYRSQIYTEKTGVNSLVKAAAPLLSLLGKVNAKQLCFDEEFKFYLEHEFKALISESLAANFAKEQVQMAYYMLQAAFLEAESQTEEDVIEVRTSNRPNANSYNKGTAKTQPMDFFSLFEQYHEALPLDLLELGYLLLSLGYRGKYRTIPNGTAQLSAIAKRLYQSIRTQRGEFSHTLGLSAATIAEQSTVPSLSIRSILSFTLGILLVLYLSFNFVLELTAAPTYQELQRIQQVLAGSNEPFLISS